MMNLARLIQTYRKRKSIGRYVTQLQPVLERLYGKSDYYTPKQVKHAAQEAKLPMDDLCYGLSIYCTQADFDAYHANSGEDCHYWDMRVEVAEHHFHGNAAFTPQDVVAHTEADAVSHSGAGFGGHHDAGGHHGGHDGGGGHF